MQRVRSQKLRCDIFLLFRCADLIAILHLMVLRRTLLARNPHRLVQMVFGRNSVRTGQPVQDRREGPLSARVPANLVAEVSGGENLSFGMAQFPTGIEKMASKIVQSKPLCFRQLPDLLGRDLLIVESHWLIVLKRMSLCTSTTPSSSSRRSCLSSRCRLSSI